MALPEFLLERINYFEGLENFYVEIEDFYEAEKIRAEKEKLIETMKGV